MVQYSKNSSPLGCWGECGCGNLMCETKRPYSETIHILDSALLSYTFLGARHKPVCYEIWHNKIQVIMSFVKSQFAHNLAYLNPGTSH